MERFISFMKKGKATVQLMYSQYGTGGVLPKGQNHKPRLFPSRKWCEITATTNMYGRDRRKEMFCANHTCSIGARMKTIVVAWRNGLLLRWRASWKKQRAVLTLHTSTIIEDIKTGLGLLLNWDCYIILQIFKLQQAEDVKLNAQQVINEHSHWWVKWGGLAQVGKWSQLVKMRVSYFSCQVPHQLA